MKKFLFLFLFTALSVSLYSQTNSEILESKIDFLADSVMVATGNPGMIIYAKCGDFEYEKTKGFSNPGSQTIMDINNLWRIGSVTKTFTITVLMQLVQEGLLDLNDPVSKYLDFVPNGNNITIKMLTDMRSGIYNYSETKEFEDSLTLVPLKKWRPEELLDLAFRYKPYFEPNKDFHYSNTNTIIIGLLIEKLTGNSLESETKKRIIDKLNLKNTYIPSDNKMKSNAARGFNMDSDSLIIPLVEVTERFDPSWAGAAGDIISNLNDMKIYIKALAKGELLNEETQNLRKDFYRVNDFFEYGIGWFRMYGKYYGHNGGYPGYTNISVYDPYNDCCVIVFYNQQSNVRPDNLAMDIIKLFEK